MVPLVTDPFFSKLATYFCMCMCISMVYLLVCTAEKFWVAIHSESRVFLY